MSEDKTEEFIELINEQNRIREEGTDILKKMMTETNYNGEEIKNSIETLLDRHEEITKKIQQYRVIGPNQPSEL